MDLTNAVEVTVSLSGWLASYFSENTLTLVTKPCLADALPDLVAQITALAQSTLPNGGMHILVNGTQARVLVKQGYILQPGDEITLVPVVAGGASRAGAGEF